MVLDRTNTEKQKKCNVSDPNFSFSNYKCSKNNCPYLNCSPDSPLVDGIFNVFDSHKCIEFMTVPLLIT